MDPENYSDLYELIDIPEANDLPSFDALWNTQEPPTLSEDLPLYDMPWNNQDPSTLYVHEDGTSSMALLGPGQGAYSVSEVDTGVHPSLLPLERQRISTALTNPVVPPGLSQSAPWVSHVPIENQPIMEEKENPSVPPGLAHGAMVILGKKEQEREKHRLACINSRANIKQRKKGLQAVVFQLEKNFKQALSNYQFALNVRDSYSQKLQLIKVEIQGCKERIGNLGRQLSSQEKLLEIFSQQVSPSPNWLEVAFLENELAVLSLSANFDDWMLEKKQLEDEVKNLEEDVRLQDVHYHVLCELNLWQPDCP